MVCKSQNVTHLESSDNTLENNHRQPQYRQSKKIQAQKKIKNFIVLTMYLRTSNDLQHEGNGNKFSRSKSVTTNPSSLPFQLANPLLNFRTNLINPPQTNQLLIQNFNNFTQ